MVEEGRRKEKWSTYSNVTEGAETASFLGIDVDSSVGGTASSAEAAVGASLASVLTAAILASAALVAIVKYEYV